LAAQETPPAPTPDLNANSPQLHFRSRAILIQVPILVKQKSGEHLPGLTRSDFRIFEDGIEQRIASFEEVRIPDHLIPASAPTPGEYTNIHADVPQVMTVIAVDMANTPHNDQIYARAQLVRYLAGRLSPNQRIALVSISTRGLGIIHDVDSDPQALIRALQRADAGIPATQAAISPSTAPVLSMQNEFNPARSITAASLDQRVEEFMKAADAKDARNDSDRSIETTLRAFQSIAWSLSGIPGRKSLVWITDGMPLARYSTDGAMPGYLETLHHRAIQSLNDAQVALYSVDASGLGGSKRSSPSSDRVLPGSLNPLNTLDTVRTSTQTSMNMLADQTGGRAFYNTNNLEAAFRSVAEDSGSYYLLTYYLVSGHAKPGWRSLKVSLDRHGVNVRYRTGFYVPEGNDDLDANRRKDLEFALISPFNCTGVPMTIRWLPASTAAGSKAVNFAVHLSAESFTLDPDGNRFNLEFAAVAYKEGKNAGHAGDSLQGHLKDATLAKFKVKGLNYEDSLSNLSPGEYRVRFVVRDNLSGRVGSVSAPLVVN
jgi:VWFA-related protein